MVINHFRDHDPRDLRPIDSPACEERDRIVVRAENKAIFPPEMDSELVMSIGPKLMALAGNPFHLRQRGSSLERRDAALQELPVISSPGPLAALVSGAVLLQLSI